MIEIKARNKKLDEATFLRERKEVLSMWPTGKEVDLQEAIAYQKGLSEKRSFLKVVERLHREGKTVVFPRAGTPILEDEIELVRTLVEAGLPLIPVTPDSYCRTCQFEKAKQGLAESMKAHRPMLNGYPTVIHGVKNTRKMTEANEAAYNQRLTNLDIRLMAEIAFASGMTAALVDPFNTFGGFEKTATAEDCLRYCQYVWRLMGIYAENGVILTMDIDGWPLCMPFPQGVSYAGIVVTALIAAEQGVKSILPWTYMLGNMAQDIGWARMMRKLCREYLDRFGFKDVKTPGLFMHQSPLMPAPRDMPWSFAFSNYSAVVAALGEAEAAEIRTIDEAAGIPTKEAHAMTHRAAKWVFDVVRQQKIRLDEKEIDVEERMSDLETRAILDRVFELGEDDALVGWEMAVRTGVVDSAFCPNINVKDKVLGVRDLEGALRYVDFGNIPIPEEVKEFHREKVAKREKAEGRKMDYRAAVEDFFAPSNGKLIGTPF
jgi:methylaspartate mutase epsilon subunit